MAIIAKCFPGGRARRIANLASLLLALTAANVLGAVQYSIKDLGTINSPGFSHAYAINASGQVTGDSGNSVADDAFLYSPGSGMLNLHTLGGIQSQGFGINDQGQVVGWSYTPANDIEHPFVYTPASPTSGTMTDLGPAIGPGVAYAINGTSQITGFFFPSNGSGNEHAFLYTPNVGSTDLGTLTHVLTDRSEGRAINASGQVVGWSTATVFNGVPLPHAFLYTNGQMTDLGTLGGTGSFNQSWAYAVNSSGQIAGDSYTTQFQKDAFLYMPGVGMADLGSFGNGANVLGMNDLDQLVGYTDPVPGGVSHAFVYNPGSGFTQLNLLIPANSGWNLTEATAINNAGQIVGYGTNPSGATEAFLLTPVPEPTALALLALSTPGLLSRPRRRPATTCRVN